MTRLDLGRRHPFTVVVTATRREPHGRRLRARVDLNAANGSVRLCFDETASLVVLRNAVCRLLGDLQTVPPGAYVRSNVFSLGEPDGPPLL